MSDSGEANDTNDDQSTMVVEFANYTLNDFVNSRTLIEILSGCKTSMEVYNEFFKLFGLKSIGNDMQDWEKEFWMVEFLNKRVANQDAKCVVTLAMLVEFTERHGLLSAVARKIKKNANLIIKEIGQAKQAGDNETCEVQQRSANKTTSKSSAEFNSNGIDIEFRIDNSMISMFLRYYTIDVVYHQDQLSAERIDLFMSKLREAFGGERIAFVRFDLHVKSFDDIKSLFKKNQPVFAIYDNDLHCNILNQDNADAARNAKESKLLFFYHLVYDQYCRDGFTNKWFYAFSLNNFSDYLTNGHFKFNWMLQKIENDDEKTLRVAKFKEIPSDINDPEAVKQFVNELNDFKKKFRTKLITAY